MAEFKTFSNSPLYESHLGSPPLTRRAIFETDLDLSERSDLRIVSFISAFDLLPSCLTRFEGANQFSVFYDGRVKPHLDFMGEKNASLPDILEFRENSLDPIVSPLLGLELIAGTPLALHLVGMEDYRNPVKADMLEAQRREFENFFQDYIRQCEQSVIGLPLVEATYTHFQRVILSRRRLSDREHENMPLFFGQKIFDLIEQNRQKILLSHH